jgi:hypothetical protein
MKSAQVDQQGKTVALNDQTLALRIVFDELTNKEKTSSKKHVPYNEDMDIIEHLMSLYGENSSGLGLTLCEALLCEINTELADQIDSQYKLIYAIRTIVLSQWIQDYKLTEIVSTLNEPLEIP